MALRRAFLLPALALLVASAPTIAQAQSATSISGGWVWPRGDLDRRYDRGLAVRAQQSFSALVLDLHLQAGVTRLKGAPSPTTPGGEVPPNPLPPADDATLLHGGMGLRLGLGLGWIGGTAAYFVGDLEDEFTFLPEVGVGLGPAELVAEVRWGERRWVALRAGLRF